jgi:hypothetical protein
VRRAAGRSARADGFARHARLVYKGRVPGAGVAKAG